MSTLHRIANDQWLARAIILLVVAAVLIAALIEFSKRRGAAAIARELARVPAETTQQPALPSPPGAEAVVMAPQAAVLDRTNADHDIEYLPGAFEGENRPLAPGERCIQGMLFRRIPGGWEQIAGRKCS